MVAHDAGGTVDVRRAAPADLAAARSVLARALAPDPLMDWIFGSHPHRDAAVAAFLWAPIEAYVLAGTTWLATDGGRAVGAAAWSVPGTEPAAADGGPALPGRSMVDLLLPTGHVAEIRSGFEAMHGQLPDEPHALLHLLGVDADRRGAGVGGALVDASLAGLPPDLPAHVNTTVDANVRFYEAHGFVHVSAVRLGARGPAMHALRRPPER
ncbi:GNAT family N-acetyltransferase [uncultured Cellulomonas sp.]|uniref:GNAT family N-acetyltransferase n=1 Tax=uncultured Cellulomonas sp. TaxID=189682 RepID=UPI0028EABCDF|nr:GNAT family N-acetyltransferase [uncultured Cellulomonas sp.]